MYCSSCGSAVPQSLTYCNRCGAKVSGAKADGGGPSELSPNALLNVVAAVFVFGLAAFVALMALMKQGNGFHPVILVAAMLSFILTLIIEAALIWLLFKSRRGAKAAGAAERLKEQTTRELGEAQERLLPEPLTSVTDHTTRTFDPVYHERKSKSGG